MTTENVDSYSFSIGEPVIFQHFLKVCTRTTRLLSPKEIENFCRWHITVDALVDNEGTYYMINDSRYNTVGMYYVEADNSKPSFVWSNRDVEEHERQLDKR